MHRTVAAAVERGEMSAAAVGDALASRIHQPSRTGRSLGSGHEAAAPPAVVPPARGRLRGGSWPRVTGRAPGRSLWRAGQYWWISVITMSIAALPAVVAAPVRMP